MIRAIPVAVGLVLSGLACASAQTPKGRPFRALTSAVEQADSAQSRELRIQWTATQAAAGQSAAASNTFTLLQQTLSSSGLRKERAPEVSPNHLVIVVEDGSGRELDWRLIQNPRIVRAEVPGPDGKLTGRVIEQGSVEFLLAIPNLPSAERIRIYRPVWNGKDYNLEPLAQLALGSVR